MLQMAGIDYEKADLSIRSLFSFQNHVATKTMVYIKEKYRVDGVVILFTCNRTEVYISVEDKIDNLFDIICLAKNMNAEKYRNYAVERFGMDAVNHLFELACGMKSKVFGEDQIITQVKNALLMAREVKTTNSYLERVFQTALAAAKKVRTNVRLTPVNTSVVDELLRVLRLTIKGSKDKKCEKCFKGKKCLVIGNGGIGRLAAASMAEEGANVTVTVRNYKTRQVEIPKGCKVVDYKDRYIDMGLYDIIISATTSPHYTIKYDECRHIFANERRYILADLAVPRDISEQFNEMENIILYNIDNLGQGSYSGQDDEAVKYALEIIKDYENKLNSEENIKEYITTIQNISEFCSNLVFERAKKELKAQCTDIDEVEKIIRKATQRTVSSMLFDLKKNLPFEYYSACIDAIEDWK